MATTIHFVAALVLSFLLQDVHSADVSDERFNALVAKIGEMESEFKMKLSMNEREISGLKLKVKEMESNFKMKEGELLDQIHELKTTLAAQPNADGTGQQLGGTDDIIQRHSRSSIKRRRSNFRQMREAPEMGVAFYATHPTHDVHHLGTNQVLEFPLVVTNIGLAFNNNSGTFVAPVDGTYVLHATVMGIDVAANAHTHAHFDVNGTTYSRFYVTRYDQSSQMLVIDLKAGDTVTVRNDSNNAGFVGQHYTTFSGFLLYQNFPTVSVVGK